MEKRGAEPGAGVAATPALASPIKQITRDADGKLIIPSASFEKLAKACANGPGPDRDRAIVLFYQTAAAMHFANGNDLDVKALNFALDAMVSLAPRDGLEAMLRGQMVALHSQGMEYLRRAALPDQTNGGVDCNVNRATRLLRTFAATAETLRAQCTAGRQKIIVEHVTVQPGGQAIVGAVTTGGRVGDAGKIEL